MAALADLGKRPARALHGLQWLSQHGGGACGWPRCATGPAACSVAGEVRGCWARCGRRVCLWLLASASAGVAMSGCSLHLVSRCHVPSRRVHVLLDPTDWCPLPSPTAPTACVIVFVGPLRSPRGVPRGPAVLHCSGLGAAVSGISSWRWGLVTRCSKAGQGTCQQNLQLSTARAQPRRHLCPR